MLIERNDYNRAEAALESLKGWIPLHLYEDITLAIKTGNLEDRSTRYYVEKYVLETITSELKRYISILEIMQESIALKDLSVKHGEYVSTYALMQEKFDLLDIIRWYIDHHRLKNN